MITDPAKIAKILELLRRDNDKGRGITPNQLSDAALLALIKASEEVRLQGHGKLIFEQGETPNYLVIIFLGVVFRTHHILGSKDSYSVEFAVCGNPIGEEVFFEQPGVHMEHYSAGHVRYLKIPKAEAEKIWKQYPEVTRWLLRSCRANAESIVQGLILSGSGDAKTKLAKTFLLMANKIGLLDSRGYFIPLHLSHDILGSLIGAQGATVNRIVVPWMKKGLIVRPKKHQYIVSNRKGLERIIAKAEAEAKDKALRA